VACVEVNQEPGGVAAVGTVGQLARVVGDGHLHPAKGKIARPAEIHAVTVVVSLVGYPTGNFRAGDNEGAGAFGQRHQIGYMVAVAVGHQDEVGRKIVCRRRGDRVVGFQKGINHNMRFVAVDAPGRVAVPGKGQ
jgi:hypothetical protein